MANFNNVDTFAKLQDALTNSRNNFEPDVINITGDITLTDNLPLIEEDESLTINGGGNQISGDETYRQFFVNSGTVIFDNLDFANGKAQGGDGGGGGAGLGGALFVYNGNVTVSNATFSDNQAIGGNGADDGTGGGLGLGFRNPGGDGGDGSDGGDGGDGTYLFGSGFSSGGYGGDGADGGRGSFGGNGGSGGVGGNGGSPYGAGGRGGDGGRGSFGGGGGSGGVGGTGGGYEGGGLGGDGGLGGFGGFGGGGGNGGSGGFGYRSGGAGGDGGRGGDGGFGGGGGGAGAYGGSSGNITPGYVGDGGNGGFAGGDGGYYEGDFDIANVFSGGGAGLGGAIFARSGSLTLDTVTFDNNQATGGMGGDPDSTTDDGQGLGGAVFVLDTTENPNGNNQGLPETLPTVSASNVTFSGNDAADATGNTGENGVGENQNNDDVFGTISVNDAPPTPLLDISISGTTETKEINSYGGDSQNPSLTVNTGDNNTELQLEGNGWRRLDITGFEVTEDTILNFNFNGNGESEIQGIGFDNNNNIRRADDGGQFFQVDGSQSWGIEDLDEFIVGTTDGFSQYSIPVGDFFTGEFDFLTIANDDDQPSPNAVGQFQNIELVG